MNKKTKKAATGRFGLRRMTASQQVLYDIATDPQKAENYFISLGAEKYINRFYWLCAFCIGLIVGAVIG